MGASGLLSKVPPAEFPLEPLGLSGCNSVVSSHRGHILPSNVRQILPSTEDASGYLAQSLPAGFLARTCSIRACRWLSARSDVGREDWPVQSAHNHYYARPSWHRQLHHRYIFPSSLHGRSRRCRGRGLKQGSASTLRRGIRFGLHAGTQMLASSLYFPHDHGMKIFGSSPSHARRGDMNESLARLLPRAWSARGS